LLVEYVRGRGARQEAGVLGAGFKTVSSEAAWVNGSLAHALDYDDYSAAFAGHPSVVILPAVLALGEKHHLSGKEVILAYVLGFEAGVSIAPQCFQQYLLGWHTTSTVGTIAATAAAAGALKLGVQETRVAIGIGASMAGGLKQNFGTMTKALHAGNAARNAVVAAELAQKGFTASDTILEAEQGFCRVLAGGSEVECEGIGEGLGESFAVVSPGLSLKPYPSCAATHSCIEAASFLQRRHGVDAEDVAEVEVCVSPALATAAIHVDPQTGLEGKFSYEFCVAAALLYGELGLREFTDDCVRRPAVRRLMHTVRRVHPPEMAPESLGCDLIVRLKNGTVLRHKIETPRGGEANPMSWDQIASKYRDCASLVLRAAEVERTLECISGLELVADVGDLTRMLTFGDDGSRTVREDGRSPPGLRR